MLRIDFNDSWQREELISFANNVAHRQVGLPFRLPEDAMIAAQRSPDSPNGPDCAWHMGETYVYLKMFDVPESWRGQKVALEFEGVFQNTSVFVNNQFAGKCPNGYTGFVLPIQTLLHYGTENCVKVVARTGMQQTSRWYTGGGIYRPVWLLRGGTVHIHEDGPRAETLWVDRETARICVRTPVCSMVPSRERRIVSTVVKDSCGRMVASDSQPVTFFGQEKLTVTACMDIPEVRLWSPDTPELYTVETVICQDGETEDLARISLGIRTFDVSRTYGLRINGVSMKLRGACIHHDNGPIGAISLKDAELRRVRKLKEAGFNAVRSAHNPMSEAMLEACDEVGMVVMDELFDVWNESKRDHDYSLYFEEYWPLDIQRIVRKDFNHPSVLFYTIGNEIPETGTPWGASRNRAMAELLRKEDPTRLVVNCLNGLFSVMPHIHEIMDEIDRGSNHAPGDINTLMTTFDARLDDVMCHQMVTDVIEETFAGVDVCGYNYMQARYIPDGERYPNRIIIGSETNPDKIGYNWPLICSLNYVIGDFCWTGWDYIGEAGVGKNDYDCTGQLYGPWPWYLAWCGDHDICGERRPQSYYREIVYGLRDKPYLCVEMPEYYGKEKNTSGWSWPDVVENWTWPGYEGKPVLVEVYSNSDRVELFCDDVLLGSAEVGTDMPYKAVFHTVYQSGTLTAVSYRGQLETGRMMLKTTDTAAKLQVNPDCQEIKVAPDHLIYVEVMLTDVFGERVFVQDCVVTLMVEGPAVLAGYASGDPTDCDPFHLMERKTFRGRALAVLRTTGEAGTVKISAAASGVESGAAVVQVISK